MAREFPSRHRDSRRAPQRLPCKSSYRASPVHATPGASLDYDLKPGDRVRLTHAGVTFYGGAWPHFVPQGQGGGTAGTLLSAEDRPHKPGAAPRPYYVRWDSGVENSYRVEDLEAVPTIPELPAETPSNVVAFLRPRKDPS